jgi:hypothetical protein
MGTGDHPGDGAERAILFAIHLDVLPLNRTIYGWNFPIMIPRPGDGEFHESIEVF